MKMMGTRFVYWAMVVMAILTLSSCSEDENWLKEHHYYYRGGKVAITLNLSKRFVVVTGDGVTKNFEASAMRTWNLSDRNAKGYIIDIRQEGMSLSDLMANDDVIAIEYVVGKDEAHLTPMLGEFYVKLKDLGDIDILKEEARKIDCEVVRSVATMEDWIVLFSRKDGRINNALDACNWLYETGLFESVDYGFGLIFEDL